jgi:aerobic C4-dicarboxylate transport protein
MNDSAVMTPTARSAKKPFYRTLYFHLLIAILLGVLLGHFMPSLAVQMKPLGDAFIKLVKMVIGPIIFCTVVSGMAGMGDIKKVGRVGGKALLYFEVVSTLSLVIGLVAGHLFRPGNGFNLNPATIDTKALAGYTTAAHEQNTVEFLMHIIPDTVVSAFSTGNVLQILLISVLFGAALAATGEYGRPLVSMIDRFAQTFFGIVHIIMKFAAIGAFGSIAFTIGTYGIGAVLPLLKLIGAFYLTLAFFVLIVLGIISRLLGFSILRFLSYMLEIGGGSRDSSRLFVQSRWHQHLSDDGRAVYRAGVQH